VNGLHQGRFLSLLVFREHDLILSLLIQRQRRGFLTVDVNEPTTDVVITLEIGYVAGK
jgi:hypothetical protein